VADFVDTILSKATLDETLKDLDANALCLKAERMANEVVETIVLDETADAETEPGNPEEHKYLPSKLIAVLSEPAVYMHRAQRMYLQLTW